MHLLDKTEIREKDVYRNLKKRDSYTYTYA